MDVAWQTAFADVRPGLIPASRAFWEAVTGSTGSAPMRQRGELLPLQPSGGDPYLWLQQ